ncbi:MAG: type II secretion system protein [candidate division WOR-3 bacterium]
MKIKKSRNTPSIFTQRLVKNKAFTLIELIFALFIFSILSTVLFTTLFQIYRRTNENRWKDELTEEGVKISNIIQRNLINACEIIFADEDSLTFLNEEGKISSFSWRDSLLFKSKEKIVSKEIKVISFKFIYYLSPNFLNESSPPVYYLPLDLLSLKKIKVIDWEIKLKKGRTTIHLKSGVFIRNIRL